MKKNILLQAHALPGIDGGGAWRPRVRAPYSARADKRGLLAIHHPWQPSRRGNYGQWHCLVAPPAAWKPGLPLFVSFYQSDNYCGAWQENAWMGAQAFSGHRFKQLLVNGRLVWEQDVADDELAADEPSAGARRCTALARGYQCRRGLSGYRDPYRLVDITRHAAARISLTFRMVDKAGSRTALQGDHYQRFSWSACDPAKAAANFQTSVYFGDVALTLKRKTVRPPPAVIAALRARPRAPHLPGRGVGLDLLVPGKLPAPGYPVRCGIPFPGGMLKGAGRLALHDARGQRVPCAMRGLSRWQDGSIRWLLCEFVAMRGQRYRLAAALKKPRVARAVKVLRDVSRTSVANDLVRLDFGEAGEKSVIRKIALRGGIECPGLHFTMKLNRVGWREEFVSVVRTVRIEQAHSICAVVRVEGDMLSAGKRRLGPFQARFEVWAGLPYVLGQWRVVNESDQSMAMLLDWSARLALPDLHGAIVDFGPFRKGYDRDDPSAKGFAHFGEVADPRRLPLPKGVELSCRQERADLAQILCDIAWVATAKQAAGFASLNHPAGGLVAAMRWFAEEFPKGFRVRPGMLSLATLPEASSAIAWRHDRPQARIGRGEAKTQGFALWLHSGKLAAPQAERFNRCVQDAPRLFRQAWFIASEALEAGPARQTTALALWRRKATPAIEQTGIGTVRLGHREYWDTAWMNNYRDRLHQGVVQFVETGDSRWWRYVEAAAAHHRDVDLIHFCPEHPGWVGSCHQYGEDHTACEPMGNIGLNVDGLLDHYLMTGDPGSLAAARGLAQHVLGCESWARSARSVGWPLAQVVRWYEHSGDSRFLRKARELVDAATTYIEPRRGIFNELHGTYSYRGAVPFMTGYMAFGLIRYHRLTAEPRALRLLHLLAEGLFAEAQLPRGGFCYSPFPELNVGQTAQNVAWMSSLVGGLAGYLHFATGGALHAQRAAACYRAMLAGRQAVGAVSMDMLPTASWMLRLIAKRRGQPPRRSHQGRRISRP